MGAVLRYTPRSPRPPGGGGFGPTTVADLRAEIEAGVQVALDVADHFIALLDRIDGDPDLEDGGDAEPSLAAPENHQAAQITWLRGSDRDLEVDRQPEARTPEREAPGEAETGYPASRPDHRKGSTA